MTNSELANSAIASCSLEPCPGEGYVLIIKRRRFKVESRDPLKIVTASEVKDVATRASQKTPATLEIHLL